MSVAHKGTLLPIRKRPIALQWDDAYWSFDHGLWGTRRGQIIEPLSGYVATLRPGEGRFGGAVAVEEGTTNLYSNPFFKDGITGWGQYNWSGGGTAYVEAMKTPVGDYALVMDNAAGTNPLAVTKEMTLPDATSDYTLSLLVKNLSDQPCTLNVYMGSGYHAVGTVNPGDGWVRLTRTYVAGEYTQSSTHHFRIAEGRKVAIAAIQLEQKPFATSFVDGSRAYGRIQYPVSGTPNGTMLWWNKFHTSVGILGRQSVLLDGRPHGAQWYVERRPDGRFHIGGTVSLTAGPVDAEGGAWHMWTFTWDETGVVRLFFDGIKIAETTGADTSVFAQHTGVRLGYSSDTYSPDALYDELVILPYAASEAEIRAWYEADAPFYHPYDASAVAI